MVSILSRHYWSPIIQVLLLALCVGALSSLVPWWVVIAASLGIGLGLAALWQPALILYVSVAIAPFHFLLTRKLFALPNVGIGDLSLAGLYQDMLPLIGLVAWGILLLLKPQRYRIAKSNVNSFILMLMAWALIRALNSNIPLLARAFGLRALFRYVPFYFIAAGTIRETRMARSLGIVLISSHFLVSVLGLFELPEFFASGLTWEQVYHGISRFYGVFGVEGYEITTYSNVYAMMLSFGFLFLVSFWVYGQFGSKAKACSLIVIIPIFVNIMFTFSRRGWFNLVAGSLLFFMVDKRLSRRFLRIVFVVIFVSSAFYAIMNIMPSTQLVLQRLQQNPLADSSFVVRVKDYHHLLNAISEKPFWGWGIGSTGPVGVRFNVSGAVNSHNYYLMLTYELGLIGLLLWGGMIVASAGQAWKVARGLPDGALKAVAAAIFAILVLMAADSLLGTIYEAFPLDLYFWILLGTLIAIPRIKRHNELDSDSKMG